MPTTTLIEAARPVRITRAVFDGHIWEPTEQGYRESVGNRSYGELFTFLQTHLATMLFDGRPFASCIEYCSRAGRYEGITDDLPLPGYRRVAVWTFDTPTAEAVGFLLLSG